MLAIVILYITEMGRALFPAAEDFVAVRAEGLAHFTDVPSRKGDL
jgi:hypothetical protein